MKKIIVIPSIIGIIIVLLFLYLYIVPSKIYESDATIKFKSAFIQPDAYLKLDDINDEMFLLDSNVFLENQKVKVKYYKQYNKYHITNIETYPISKEETKKQITEIIKSKNADEVKELITCTSIASEAIYNDLVYCQKGVVIPVKAQGVSYDKIIDENMFIQMYDYKLGLNLYTKQFEIKLDKTVELLSIESIIRDYEKDETKITKKDYNIIDDKILLTKSKDESLYYITIQLENNNIYKIIIE